MVVPRMNVRWTGAQLTRVAAVFLCVVFVLLIAAQSADARRRPTMREKARITAALTHGMSQSQISCVKSWNIRVSTVRTGWAYSDQPTFNDLSCGWNGFNYLRKRHGKWRIVYSGSELACGVIPVAVAMDLNPGSGSSCIAA